MYLPDKHYVTLPASELNKIGVETAGEPVNDTLARIVHTNGAVVAEEFHHEVDNCPSYVGELDSTLMDALHKHLTILARALQLFVLSLHQLLLQNSHHLHTQVLTISRCIESVCEYFHLTNVRALNGNNNIRETTTHTLQ